MEKIHTEGMKHVKHQRWKRISLSFVLASSLFLPSIGAAGATSETTNLVKSEKQSTVGKALITAFDLKGHWAAEAIQEFAQKGYVKGYPDGTMKPNQTISRAEFIALVNHVYDYQEKGSISYRDVPANAWFFQEIAKATKIGYIKGFEDGTMRPSKEVTRQVAATIIARLQELTNNPDGINQLADRQEISSWSKGAIGAVIQAGYMQGMPNGTFQPGKPMTRAEAIAALHNVMKTINGTESQDPTKQTTYDKAGTYGGAIASEKETIQGDVIVSADEVNLQNLTIEGNLTIDEAVGEGEVSLKNVTVTGELFVKGGGNNSVYLIDSTIKSITTNKQQGEAVRIVVRGTTTINNLVIESTTTVVVEGGTIQSITIEATAPNTILDAKNGAIIGELLIRAISKVLGGSSINHVIINVNGVTIEGDPQKIKLANGIRVMINGQIQTNSTTTNNSSSSGESSGGSGGNGSSDTTAQDTIDVVAAKAALQIRFTSDDTISFVTSDLILDHSGANGTTIAWESDKPRIIAPNGVVTRPSFTLGDQDVTLTATITKGSISDTKEFTVKAIKLAETQDDRDVADAKSKVEIGFTSGDSIALVTNNITLPTTGEHGTTITWASNKSYVDSSSGMVRRPYYTLGNQQVNLTATITKGTVYDTLPITITVREGDQSLEAQVNGFADGKGTITEPYIITNADHLNNIRNHSDKSFHLAADINLNQAPYNTGPGWEPIYEFTGSLNGNAFKISNLMIDRPNDTGIGLFSTNEGRVFGIILENVNITGKDGVGGLAGHNQGTVYNINVNGTVTGESLIGGFAGVNTGSIEFVHVNGTIVGGVEAGGFVSYNMGTISNSSMKGLVQGEHNIAGFVFSNQASGELINNYITANVSGTEMVAGFVVSNFGKVMNNYVVGNVTGTNNVAGFVGGNDGTIMNNYTTGNVTGNNGVGGFVAYNTGTVMNNYTTGVVTGEADAGVFVHTNDGGTLSNNYFNSSNPIQQPIAGVTGVTLTNMKQKATFNKWDFTNEWDITNNNHHPYPYLRSNPDNRLQSK